LSRTAPFIEPDWPAPASVLALSTTRAGGLSAPPYSSFNMGHHVGDSAAAVAANRALLAQSLPPTSTIAWLSQIHGTSVVEAQRGEQYPQADAVWSMDGGVACAILTADCLPVLFCSISGDRVAAAHAGWRGLLHGVLEATVEALGLPPGDLLAWLGPAIGPRAFEVGPEVRDAFLAAPAASTAAVTDCFVPNPARPGHYYADLYSLARQRLRQVGLTRVYGGDFCTFTESQRFFSYRRDGQTGRMASLVMLRSA
jgi:YfiH family protein